MRTREWKENEIKTLKKLTTQHKVIGVVGMRDIPAKQLQTMRKDLGVGPNRAVIRMTKNPLIHFAVGSDPRRKELCKYVEDQTALIFTDMNPFKLYKTLEKNKTKAPLKGNAVAPYDIVIPDGDTPFKPGPMLGELQSVGIPAVVERGKVVVRKPTTVLKKGERTPRKLADILAKMDIQPMEVGLRVKAVWEDGVVYTPDVLKVDEEKVMADFVKAVQHAFSLATDVAYPAKEVIETLLMRAKIESLNLAVNAAIFEKDALPQIITRAQLDGMAIKNLISKKQNT